jgi:hypothetical protein
MKEGDIKESQMALAQLPQSENCLEAMTETDYLGNLIND